MENMLSEFSKLFLQMIKVSDLPWKDLISAIKTNEIDQLNVAEATVCHPSYELYSPSSEYVKIFLKRIISELENIGIEVNEILYTKYVDLVSSVLPHEEFYYRTYTLNKSLRISLKETRNLIVDGTTGLTTWQASHVLSQYCLENKRQFASKSVLELGSGLGLTGIALIKSCSLHQFTFTDHHHKVLEYLRHNVNINLYGGQEVEDNDVGEWEGTKIKIRPLDWEAHSEIHETDFVIGADILFDVRLIPSLISVLATCLRREKSKAIIAATIRNEHTFKCFMDQTATNGLSIESIEERTYQESASQPSALVKIVTFNLPSKLT